MLRDRLNISRLAIKYSWLTICFWLAITMAGLLAFSSLKYALFPDITFPVVVVNATADFSTAGETENQLTIPIEKQLQSLSRLDDIRSSTYPGRAVVNVSFTVGTNIESSVKQVKTALENVELPATASFEVIPVNLNQSAAVSYAIASTSFDLNQLTEITETAIIPEITNLPGVLRIDLLGNGTHSETTELESPATLVRFNGENALAFQVIKESEANTLEVVNRVEEIVANLQAELPEVELTLAATQADYIREATQATIDALILAIVLAVVVIFVFLRNWQATLITALAIPVSLLGTFIVMAIAGFNLETITLLALALVIGIIVDDAIVDVENIMRHIEAGETPKQAAISATKEIGLTVSASTLTIVAVFLPVALMGGTIGQFFKPFGLTVSAAVLFSLSVARTLSPVLAVYWLKGTGDRELGTGNRESKDKFNYFERNYQNLLQWSLNHRQIVVAIAVCSLIAGVALIPLIPKGFIPKLDRGEFNIVYTTALPQLSGGANENVSKEEENINLQSNSVVNEETEFTNQDTGDSLFGEGAFDWLVDIAKSPTKVLLTRTRKVGEQLEEIVLNLAEVESVYTVVGVRGEPNRGRLYVKLKRDRTNSTTEIQAQLRTSLPQLKNVTTSIEDIQFIELESTKPLQVAFLGNNHQQLQEIAQEVKTKLEEIPGFADITASGEDDNQGIERLNNQPVAYLTANLNENLALGKATDEVVARSKPILPANVILDLKGDSGLSNHVLKNFTGTITLAVICMLGLLLLLFGRLLEPIVVALSLPLSIVGAMLALLLTQSDFGMISLIGLIFLIGLLDKNALLLMDYANQLRQQGLNRTEAILKTGTVRLRPILMTTASTILGMLPLAVGIGAGAELRQPMAVAIIGGLVTSTLLSLIVVPVLYTLLEDLGKFRTTDKNHLG
ncbi:efflux RND transporter permease subunit [Oscillatoria salina]|uniref:efflux RND transporter permease subunit n=1 Tax=Oscillatoria salina TaxID=331517 RepID=UPI001CC9EB7C|nr:efflux RND transporter permease subunit [Oscillatoria salina]MBZ8180964.1 efflux RND transporter permease subunit [Oscillatoria salina IIICB1]